MPLQDLMHWKCVHILLLLYISLLPLLKIILPSNFYRIQNTIRKAKVFWNCVLAAWHNRQIIVILWSSLVKEHICLRNLSVNKISSPTQNVIRPPTLSINKQYRGTRVGLHTMRLRMVSARWWRVS